MKLILILSLFLAGNTAYAQFLADAARPLPRTYGRALPLTSDGKQITSQNSDIAGIPFFTENWCNTNLQLANGDVFNTAKAKLDVMNNNLHYIDSHGAEMYVEAKELKRVEFITADSVLHSFVVHAVVKGGKEVFAFYEALSEGKITLLKQVKKQLEENKNGFTQEVTKEIVTKETAYVFFNAVLTPVKSRESFWQAMMEDKWPGIQAYAGQNGLGFKSLEDVQKIVAYYNAAQ
jgi:hypothetical protein